MPKKAQLRPSKIFHPTSATELHNVHTVFHTEVLVKEPLIAGPELCQADERGNFNKMFPCSLALDGDSRNVNRRIKLLLYSPAVNVLQHKMSPNTGTEANKLDRGKYLRYEHSLSEKYYC